ncbi:MAG: preprotein translocase subunit SecF [Actinomycetota bacterium]|jgi:preprotein translocase subunit SecF|nr:preprotein translocase subunit SecF [Actinomycetota bacterium]MEA2487842.1 preprotein translocase subunit SecF [Actinomycetota bacterium]
MAKGRLHRLYHGETRVDFVGRRRLWYVISLVLIGLSVGSIVGRNVQPSCHPPFPSFFKGLSCGIEFKGGISVSMPVPSDGPLADAADTNVVETVRSAASDAGAPDAQVQVATDPTTHTRQVIVQTSVGSTTAQTNVQNAVATAVGEDTNSTDISSQQIGSSWGGEITNKAVRALIIFLIVIVAFISYRFEWKMAVAAFLALLHDLLITAGVYSVVGFEVTPSTIIAILTILGYSLYDTVVVFDKVEENTTMFATTGKMTYQDSANLAMNQVFMRSLNTSLATLLPVSALLFVGAGLFGVGTLKDLALALFVGILSGTYSSIFVATPVLSQLKEREPRYKNIRARVLRDATRAQQVSSLTPAEAAASLGTSGGAASRRKSPAAPAAAATDGETVEPVAVGSSVKPRTSTRPGPKTSKGARARSGSKKAKRRKRR